MSIDDTPGDRLIPSGADRTRWQHRLFVEIRKAPAYRRIIADARRVWEANGREGAPPETLRAEFYYGSELDRKAPYFLTLEQAVRDLRLSHHGTPCPWAIMYLHDDMIDRFDPDQPPPTVALSHSRLIELSISAVASEVIAYREKDIIEHHVEPDGTQHTTHRNDVVWHGGNHHERGMIGAPEWRELERLAIEAARRAVADLRASALGDYGSGLLDMTTIRGKREAMRATQIERLALRMMGRAGTRNDRRTDERWCDRLGIDVPN